MNAIDWTIIDDLWYGDECLRALRGMLLHYGELPDTSEPMRLTFDRLRLGDHGFARSEPIRTMLSRLLEHFAALHPATPRPVDADLRAWLGGERPAHLEAGSIWPG